MANLFIVVAKVFSNTLTCCIFKFIDIFCCKNMSYSHCFSKNINVFAIFQDRNFNVTLANNSVKGITTGPRLGSFTD